MVYIAYGILVAYILGEQIIESNRKFKECQNINSSNPNQVILPIFYKIRVTILNSPHNYPIPNNLKWAIFNTKGQVAIRYR